MRRWRIRRGREYWTGKGWSSSKGKAKVVEAYGTPWSVVDGIDDDDEDIWIEEVGRE